MESAEAKLGTEFFNRRVKPSLDIITQTLQTYTASTVTLSFNGGKDCTVIYFLLKLLDV
jgi:hypothetical protein